MAASSATHNLARRDRWGNALLGAALLLPIILGVVILVDARRSERAQRDIANRALDHYAAVAAWQLSNRLSTEYHSHIETSLRAGGVLDHASAQPRRLNENCDCAGEEARVTFRYVPESRSLQIVWGSPDSLTRSLLSEVAQSAAASPENEPHRVVFANTGNVQRAISMVVRRADRPVVEGVESDGRGYRRIAEKILQTKSILPPQLVPPPYTDGKLAVRVQDAAGVLVYATPGSPPSASAAVDSVPALRHLRVAVEISPSVAEALIIGGLPRARTPVLLVLLVFAMLLAGAAFMQHRRARELNRLRTDFVASVSHELRTPLTQISMFGETLMLGRERSESERKQFASIIHREAARLASLLDNVLRFTRTGAGRFSLRPEDRRLSTEIDLALAAFKPLADASSATIEVGVDADVHAWVDSGAMRQILLNLLDNAVKYGPAGQRIRVALTSEGGSAALSVSDEGPGIPEADRQRIFEPFVRLPPRPKRVAGTGIGLAVVRELVTALGGSIVASDARGGGARFIILFPALESATPDRAIDAPDTVAAGV